MICLNCKKQIPDDSAKCPFCGQEVNYERQIVKEVKFRRYQRWAFYFLAVAVILGMMGVIAKIYGEYTKAVVEIGSYKDAIKAKDGELGAVQASLGEKDAKLSEINANLEKAKQELDKKTEEYKKKMADLESGLLKEKGNSNNFQNKYDQLAVNETLLFASLSKIGIGIKESDMFKFPVADANISSGSDTDGDGLSDIFEGAVGTDMNNADTDGDGFSDKAEILGGFNPRGEGKQAIDWAFVNKNKGKILLQVEGHGEVWYVGFDGKRYFLGKPVGTMGELDNNLAGENVASSTAAASLKAGF